MGVRHQRLTNAVSSCGLEISDVLAADFNGADGPLPDEIGLVDDRDGVADGATFKGRAAEAGGLIVQCGLGNQISSTNSQHMSKL